MFDARIPHERAVVAEAGFAIKAGGMGLGVEVGAAESPPTGLGDEGGQKRGTDAATPRGGDHGHAADLHRPGFCDVEAAGPKRRRVGSDRQGVHGEGIGAVVFVALFLRRNVLFVYEDGGANRERRAHPKRI